MKRKLSLAIGVADAESLPFVRGAINGARAFAKWAARMGYDSHLLVDDPGPVKVDDLEKKLSSLLNTGGPIERLLLYFCGHGMLEVPEERLWFLSEWESELKLVNVDILRRRLMHYYDIEQIGIFSDACSVLPKTIVHLDLTRDGVVGKGSFKPEKSPQIDRFDSAVETTAALVLPGHDSKDDQGLFSSVLMKALWGTVPDAFSSLVKDAVTSRSLAKHLEAEVPRLAEKYGRVLNPRVSPTFGEGVDIYYQDKPGISPPPFPEPMPPGAVLNPLGPRSKKPRARQPKKTPRVPIDKKMGPKKKRESAGPKAARTVKRHFFKTEATFHPEAPFHPSFAGEKDIIQALEQSRAREWPVVPSGLQIFGSNIRGLWSSEVRHWSGIGDNRWFLDHHVRDVAGVPLLIELENGACAVGTAMRDFVLNVFCTDSRIIGMVYTPTRSDYFMPPLKTAEAIAAMEAGNSPIDKLLDYSVALRYGKHSDPVLGIIAAYLYDSIGDIDSIRQMAYFYAERNQPIPFDIAFLSRSPVRKEHEDLWLNVPAVGTRRPRTGAEDAAGWTFEATPAIEGQIAGCWPLMRQGWSFLEDPLDVAPELIKPQLRELARRLEPGPFATLDSEGGRGLATQFSLFPQQG